jgi:alpha-acetolactate decarboxylase
MLESDLLIDRLRPEAESRKAETFRFMEEQKIKRSLAPAQWEALKEQLKSNCDRINSSSAAHLSVEFKDGAVRLLNVNKGTYISLAYDDSVPCVHCSVNGHRSHLAFQVANNGTSVLFLDGTSPQTPVMVSLDITAALLR